MTRIRPIDKMSLPEKIIRVTLMSIGFVFIFGAAIETAQAFESAKFAIEELCGHIQGNLGALLMAAAGVGAVISGAMGNFRASFALIIVGAGAFTTDAVLSLFFPEAADTCAGRQGVLEGVDGPNRPGDNPFANVV